jgi:hypothetical protein
LPDAATADGGTLPGAPSPSGTSGAPSAGGAPSPGGAAPVAGSAAKSNCAIEVGISYPADTNAASAEAGANSGTVNEDGAGLFQHGVDRINQSGGIAGCQVKSVAFGWHLLQDANTQNQQECDLFTQDHHVAYAMNYGGEGRIFFDCMKARKVPVVKVSDWGEIFDQSQLDASMGYLYTPASVRMDRLGVVIDTLRGQGWFGSNPKIGIVMSNIHGDRSKNFFDKVWKPKLDSYGYKVASVFSYDSSQATTTASAIATAASQSQSLVVQFRGAGVDHVLFVPGDGVVFSVLGTVANGQKWYPTWGVTSADAPTTHGIAPDDETKNVTLVGWSPSTDNGAQNGLPDDAAVQRCASIWPKSQWTTMPVPPMVWCDGLFFTQQALAGANGFSAASLLAGVNRLGSGFLSAVGFGPTMFGAHRYDGVTQGRMAHYDTAAKIYTYFGGTFSIP